MSQTLPAPQPPSRLDRICALLMRWLNRHQTEADRLLGQEIARQMRAKDRSR